MITAIKKTEEVLFFQGESIIYLLIRSKRRKRSISMKIHSDGRLQLNVPFNSPKKIIESFILEKYRWIRNNQQARLSQEKHPEPSYKDGDKHFYLGIEYPLHLIIAPQSNVGIRNNSILVHYRKNATIKSLLKNWYKQQALDYFKVKTTLLANTYQFPPIKNIKVRYMKARWGSCSSDSVITYNIHLLKADPEYIDYVILHELCHLIHPNHSKNFYRLQSQLNPDWKQKKINLNKLGNFIIKS